MDAIQAECLEIVALMTFYLYKYDVTIYVGREGQGLAIVNQNVIKNEVDIR